MLDLNKPSNIQIVLFDLDKSNYALDLSVVERVVPAVEPTPLPKAPEIVAGVINFHGNIIPVINIRKRFNHPDRALELDDQLIIARTSRRILALNVDSVTGVRDIAADQFVDIEFEFSFAKYLKGIARIENNIILIHDLDMFLSLDEEKLIDKALNHIK